MNAAEIRGDWEGRVVDGSFTLLQWLGGSEGSDVFLTELPEDRSQKVVIKLIPADAAGAKDQIASWATTANLSHPHLIRLFHTGQAQIDDVPLVYVVTEYAEEVLSQLLSERPLTATEAREMLDPVVDGLSYLHGNGFVHGHLKPSNILVVDNQLKLSGDGVRVLGGRDEYSSTLRIYDAPECATGTATAAADVWSLGVTLVEALTQHPPIWNRSTNVDPILPESIPQPFATIAQECLRADPSRRCTITEIMARLEPPQSFTEPESKTHEVAPAKFRVTALVAGALVLIVVIAILLLRSHHVEPSAPTASQQPAPASVAPPPQSPASVTQTAKGVLKGAVAERVLPDVLPSASASIQGTVNVRIRVTVDPSGEVSNATFDAPGPSKYFAKVALKAAQQWRFKPAQVDGQPASSVWVLQFQFRRSATEVTPVAVSP